MLGIAFQISMDWNQFCSAAPIHSKSESRDPNGAAKNWTFRKFFQKCHKMAQKWPKMAQNVPRMTQNDPKWPKNDPKWPAITNTPKWPKNYARIYALFLQIFLTEKAVPFRMYVSDFTEQDWSNSRLREMTTTPERNTRSCSVKFPWDHFEQSYLLPRKCLRS